MRDTFFSTEVEGIDCTISKITASWMMTILPNENSCVTTYIGSTGGVGPEL